MLSFLSAHWYMVVVAVISGVYLCWPLLGGRSGRIAELSSSEAVTLINRKQGLLLDVREDKQLAREGVLIAQARRLPASELEGRVSEIKKFQSKPVIVHGKAGASAAAAAAVLIKQGFSEVYVLAGGVDAWQKAGLPVKRVEPRA